MKNLITTITEQYFVFFMTYIVLTGAIMSLQILSNIGFNISPRIIATGWMLNFVWLGFIFLKAISYNFRNKQD